MVADFVWCLGVQCVVVQHLYIADKKGVAMKTLWLAAFILTAMTGCASTGSQTPPETQVEPQTRPDIVWLRQVPIYSDFANFSIEELPYAAREHGKSDFGIHLTFDEPDGRQIYTVHFDTASSRLSASGRQNLRDLAQNAETTNVYLSGYADPRGSQAYNMQLSKMRVASVEAFLAGEGLNVERVCAYGKTEEPDFKLCEEGMNAYE